MKFKLDENIPLDLARLLGSLGHDVDTVPQEALTGRPDSVVWSCAQEAERLLITQDLDFADLRRSLLERTAAFCFFDCVIRRVESCWIG